MTDIYVDGDACPVREEIYRVATRPAAQRFSRLQRLATNPAAGKPKREHGSVGDNAEATDDWIAERIGAIDVCVTADILLAFRRLKKGARRLTDRKTLNRSKYRQCAG